MRARFAITLSALSFIGFCAGTELPAQSPMLAVNAQLSLKDSDADFAGLSALHISPGGTQFVTASDQGTVFSGRIQRRASDQALRGVTITAKNKISLTHNSNSTRKRDRDIEGMAVSENGTVFLSLENNHRILKFPHLQEPPRRIKAPLDAKAWPANKGMEALAITPDRVLYAFAEHSGSLKTGFALYRRAPRSDWTVPYTLPRNGGFRPVGADFGPDGHLYILLRAFNGYAFASRIERLLMSDHQVTGHQLLLNSTYGQFGNLEGLSVWATPAGQIRVTAVSDNNFSKLQRSQIVEFDLMEPLANATARD